MNNERPLRSHLLLATDDDEEAQTFVTQAWEKHDHVLRHGRYGLSWHQAPVGNSALAFVETKAAERVWCSGPQGNVFRIAFHESGRIDHRINGKPAVSTPGVAAMQAIMRRRFDLARRRLEHPDPATTVTGTATVR